MSAAAFAGWRTLSVGVEGPQQVCRTQVWQVCEVAQQHDGGLDLLLAQQLNAQMARPPR
jgi:hypothetical protein